ncbi:CopD family protein [Sabulicella rubraurantiaca]|uniref:CopD family protein n=1 Tax=Sabulicella rubraurantiaca TaxID=2811429 RepID=UPI001A958A8D|nr:CopD family protein [Sabulicella rubraurantiaca]
MELFLDLYGFLSVVLKAGALASRSALVGGVLTLLLVTAPVARLLPAHQAEVASRITFRAVRVSGWATLGFTGLSLALGLLALSGAMDLPISSALGAQFVVSGFAVLGAALLLMLLVPRGDFGGGRGWALLALSLLLLAAAVGGSHAMARPEGRGYLVLSTYLHQLGAALWLGGLPVLLLALRADWPAAVAQTIGRRYSRQAAVGVGLILLGLLGYWRGYIVAPDALYGTAYGAMAATKGFLTLFLLGLGLANWVLLHRLSRAGAPEAWLPRLRRFVECEVIAGLAVFGIAASLTSVPPSVDLPDDRATWAEVTERFTPTWPRLQSPDRQDLGIPDLQARLDAEWRERQESARPQAFIPGEGFLPPRNAFDMAWSEYNHHMAGFVVLLVGIAALLDRSGRFPWARHWPLLYLLLALFLLIRSDPESWPMGDIPLLESLRDPEVLQHKLLSLLVVAFAVSEWMVRLRGRSGAASYVFPLAMVVGGFLLLTHSHAIGNIKEALLVELSHLPLGALAVIAGCARWVELRGGAVAARADGSVVPAREALWAGWVWPACMIGISMLLIFYREA